MLQALKQLLLVNQAIVIDIYSVKNFSFSEPTIFYGNAELIEDFFGRNVFIYQGFFQCRMQLFVFSAEVTDLLDGVETSYCRYELFFSDILVVV